MVRSFTRTLRRLIAGDDRSLRLASVGVAALLSLRFTLNFLIEVA